MTIEGLKFLSDQMEQLQIPYEFGEWTDGFTLPFWVGEYSEVPSNAEDGYEESTFILTGTNNNIIDLEMIKDKIKCAFDNGMTEILPDGSGISVSYENAFLIPTGDQELNRIQINLSVKIWKVK